MRLSLDQEFLKVIDPGIDGLDPNFSNHLIPGNLALSFLCDDLKYFTKILDQKKIKFFGPEKSHLGMLSVSFEGPGGSKIKINERTNESPKWLQV